ncbi:252_t:CDS:2, partial [Entrophospora sp. SA101]
DLSGQHFCTSWVDTNNKALTIKTCFNLKLACEQLQIPGTQ